MSLFWDNKDPNETLDYRIDWLPRLEADTIETSTWTVPAGLTHDDDNISDSGAETVVWLSGGTIGETYEILNRIVTVGGRTMDQTVSLTIEAK
jgi:hypothetical protein